MNGGSHLVMAGQDIIYDYEAEMKCIKLKHIVFDDELKTIVFKAEGVKRKVQ